MGRNSLREERFCLARALLVREAQSTEFATCWAKEQGEMLVPNKISAFLLLLSLGPGPDSASLQGSQLC